MMGMFAPVVTEVCLTNPCTGLFSGDDLSIPGGVKPYGHTKKRSTSRGDLTGSPAIAKVAEGGGAVLRANIGSCIIHGSFCSGNRIQEGSLCSYAA